MSKKSQKPDKAKRKAKSLGKLNSRGTGPVQDKFKTKVYDKPRSALTTAKPVTFDAALALSAVFGCIKILVESVGSLPLQMFEFDKARNRTPVYDHNLIKLLRNKPNKNQTRVEFFETFMLNLVSGNAYVKKDYIGSKLVALQVINSGSVDVKTDESGNKIYECLINGKKTDLTDNEIWHVKLFGSGLVGMSPIAYGAQSIAVGLAAADKTTRLMSNGAKPTGYLSSEKSFNKTQRDSVRSEFSELVTGADDFMAVLEGGLEFHKLSLTPEDIELVKTREMTVEDVCRYFGVPPILIHASDSTTGWGSGIEQIIDGFYRFGLRPYLERIEESLRVNVLPVTDWEKYEFEFKTKEFLRASTVTRITANKDRIISGQATINEVRREEGDAPIANGDFTLVPVNMTTAERMQSGVYTVKDTANANQTA